MIALEVDDLKTVFRESGGLFARGVEVKAVNGVSFTVARGEVLGLVGEYLGRVYDEIKGRPTYIVGEKIGFDDEAEKNS